MLDSLGPSSRRLVQFCAVLCFILVTAGVVLMGAEPREARAEREALDAAEAEAEACLAEEFCCMY